MFWMRLWGTMLGLVSLIIGFLPLVLVDQTAGEKTTAYFLSLVVIIVLDLALAGVILTWRHYARQKLGELMFWIDGFQSSLYRNLVLGGALHTLALFLLWIPLLDGERVAADTPVTGFLPFVGLAGFGALASTPWLVQFFLNVKGSDLEVHEEGLMIGGFYPCRWDRIVRYSIWEDECSLVVIEIRGRGPVEVFMAPVDQQSLLAVLQKQVGPPSSVGRSEDVPENHYPARRDGFSVIR